MKLLLDTHLLLWAAGEPKRLSKQARTSIDNPDNELLFSAASLWEVAIKRGLGREDFKVDAPRPLGQRVQRVTNHQRSRRCHREFAADS
jgi:PIN domain nuclease of toxin-antitoxin system